MKNPTKPIALALVAVAAACGAVAETDAGGGADAPTGVTASFTSLYGDYFGNCKQCHTPTALGRTSSTEQNLDFSTRNTAYTTITTKMAAGLTGNFAGCNMVPFVVSGMPAKSLLLASLDQPTRQVFDDGVHPMCDVDTITDETERQAAKPSAAFIAALGQWIADGTPNN